MITSSVSKIWGCIQIVIKHRSILTVLTRELFSHPLNLLKFPVELTRTRVVLSSYPDSRPCLLRILFCNTRPLALGGKIWSYLHHRILVYLGQVLKVKNWSRDKMKHIRTKALNATNVCISLCIKGKPVQKVFKEILTTFSTTQKCQQMCNWD